MENKRLLKVVYPANGIMMLLSASRYRRFDLLTLPVTSGIPFDAEIVEVEIYKDCFLLTLSHESFSPVPRGGDIPVHPQDTEYIEVEVKCEIPSVADDGILMIDRHCAAN